MSGYKSRGFITGSISVFFCLLLVICGAGFGERVTVTSYEQESSQAYITAAEMGGERGIAAVFEGTSDMHFYADPETAPAPHLVLQVKAEAEGVEFGEAVFPEPVKFDDPAQGKKINVYVGDFEVFVPVVNSGVAGEKFGAEVVISGIGCTSKICTAPFEHTIKGEIDFVDKAGVLEIDSGQMAGAGDAVSSTVEQGGAEVGSGSAAASYSFPVALGLAVLAGLLLNVMPCVWPVIPIIATRIWTVAGKSRGKSLALGFAFSAGIVLFFAVIAGVNIVLSATGTAFNWGDQWREPGFIAAMSLLMVVLAMFMFDVFTIGVPSSVTSKAGSGEGAAGTVGMGFLAALLATPCSFAILAAVIVWAQSQPLFLGTVTILFIGVGMSLPYIVLTSVPGLINKMPKPGGWMEKIKVGVGFVLLAIAAKLYTALDGAMSKKVLYYGIVLAFCVWMWGKWVGYTTPRFRKWGIRFAAIVIAVAAGFMVFGPDDEVVKFADYDRAEIAELSAAGEPVLVMFTADWCFNCVFVKNRVYRDAEIAELIEAKGVRLFMGDTTSKDDPATADLAGLYDEPGGVPVSILHLPDGELVKLRGMIGKEDMAEVLRKLPDK